MAMVIAGFASSLEAAAAFRASVTAVSSCVVLTVAFAVPSLPVTAFSSVVTLTNPS